MSWKIKAVVNEKDEELWLGDPIEVERTDKEGNSTKEIINVESLVFANNMLFVNGMEMSQVLETIDPDKE